MAGASALAVPASAPTRLRTLLLLATIGACRPVHVNRVADSTISLEESAQHHFGNKTDRSNSKPQLNIKAAAIFMSTLVTLPPGDCGQPLLTRVQVTADMLANPRKYLSKASVDGTWMIFAAATEDWELPLSRPFRVMQGHRLVKVNDKGFVFRWSGVRTFAKSLTSGDTMTFEVGSDFRRCWGTLQDPGGNDVCGPGAMGRLNTSVEATQARYKGIEKGMYDNLGMSAASIVKELNSFIMKSLDGNKQYQLLKEAMPAFRDSIVSAAREDGRCFSTALTPICFAATLPQDRKAEAPMWIAMRKVELPGVPPATLEFSDGDKVELFDLKGPKFGGIRDLKSNSAGTHVWHRKDKGFAEAFPEGLQLAHCGSREAALVLELDSELLKQQKFTDYSVFAQLYAEGKDPERCACDRGKPRWPLVVHTSHALDATRKLMMAVGVIDYLEQGIAGLLKRAFSTMRAPDVFKSWWMRMWPVYFKLPPRRLELLEEGRARIKDEPFGIPPEEVRVGDRVRALQKIKWLASEEEHGGKTLYGEQTTGTGSKRKVEPGAFGQVVGVSANGKLRVRWGNNEELFLVEASQVMTSPRKVLGRGGPDVMG